MVAPFLGFLEVGEVLGKCPISVQLHQAVRKDDDLSPSDAAEDGLPPALQLEDEWAVGEEDFSNPSRVVFLRRSSELGEWGAPEATHDFDGRPSTELEQHGASAQASPPPQALVDVRVDDAASGDSDIECVGVVTKNAAKTEVRKSSQELCSCFCQATTFK